VYALIINGKKEILLSDEFRMGMRMTKFPGGGLQHGEGTIDCLKREALEEFGQELEVLDHYYTTDFFQQALFYPDHQLISIYYLARFPGTVRFRISEKVFDFKEDLEGSQSFRWKPLSDLKQEDVSFPIDRRVIELLTS
jgi:8-oxo-dGTP diphosphatase